METVEQLRTCGAVTNLANVVGIYHTVFVDILILDVTHPYGRESLCRSSINLSLTGKQPLGNQTIGRAKRIARLHQIIVDTWFLCHILNLILITHEVGTDVESEIAKALSIVGCNLKTILLHLTLVQIRSIETNESGVITSTRHPDVFTNLVEIIDFEVQPPKECGIDTDVELIGFLVCGVRSSHLSECDRTVVGSVVTATEGITTTSLRIRLRVVSPHIVTRQIVGIDNAIRSTQLKEVDYAVVFQEILL